MPHDGSATTVPKPITTDNIQGAHKIRVQDVVSALNAHYRHHSATAVLDAAFRYQQAGKIALVSSFGAESVVLLHLSSLVSRDIPVFFVDTGMLFTETLVYQQELAERLLLRNIRIIRASVPTLRAEDPDGLLHKHDADTCCALRKAQPLQKALRSFDGWVTGRKRFQSGIRANLNFFEVEEFTGRIKINPLAHWSPQDIRNYMEENRLPRHPMVARGYPSIGCEPCTSRVTDGEGPRSGRWRGDEKNECGIHFGNLEMAPTGEKK